MNAAQSSHVVLLKSNTIEEPLRNRELVSSFFGASTVNVCQSGKIGNCLLASSAFPLPLLLFFFSYQAMLRPELPFSALPFVKISPRPSTTRASLTPSTTSARPQIPQIVLYSDPTGVCTANLVGARPQRSIGHTVRSKLSTSSP